MQFKNKDSHQAVLKNLWGQNVPPLTSEEIELSVQIWKKIKARRQKDRNIGLGIEIE